MSGARYLVLEQINQKINKSYSKSNSLKTICWQIWLLIFNYSKVLYMAPRTYNLALPYFQRVFNVIINIYWLHAWMGFTVICVHMQALSFVFLYINYSLLTFPHSTSPNSSSLFQDSMYYFHVCLCFYLLWIPHMGVYVWHLISVSSWFHMMTSSGIHFYENSGLFFFVVEYFSMWERLL